jgi:type VI secretion system secreted protein VgrG
MSTLAESQAAVHIVPGSQASYLFTISAVHCKFAVVSFHVQERLSSPFEMDITLATQDEVILGELLDKAGLLTIDFGVSRRHFHGIVRECTCLGDNSGYSIFHLTLVPSLWFLSLEQDCRIFQNMNAQDIICEVLKESGINSDCVRLALQVRERKREYCVQYRETDLNFISRLLEEEGIFYFFEHNEDKHILILGDTPSAYLSMQGESDIRFNIGGGMAPDEESVSNFSYSRRLCPDKVLLQDFNYKRISLDLLAGEKPSKGPEREVYDYPGNFYKLNKGDLVAQIHQERIQSLGETAEGISNCPRLAPGHKWTLTHHDFAGRYLTVSVSHSGSQPQVLGEQAGSTGFHYQNDFVVIPSSVTVRPQIVAEKRLISGIQTATVVGPKGEEIHTDGHGRIMVRFHWDRLGKKDARSSCWIRVAQSWGGLSHGAQYIPRVGDEVLVVFSEGDPDRPMVTGSVYNGDNLPIHDLDKSITQSGFRTKTHKGEGFNELRFDDANGSEEVYLHSQKDWNITVRNNESKTVGNDLVSQVGKKLTVVAGEQMQFTCGNASILLDRSGKIEIHGSEVFVSGTTLHLDGTLIKLNMGG